MSNSWLARRGSTSPRPMYGSKCTNARMRKKSPAWNKMRVCSVTVNHENVGTLCYYAKEQQARNEGRGDEVSGVLCSRDTEVRLRKTSAWFECAIHICSHTIFEDRGAHCVHILMCVYVYIHTHKYIHIAIYVHTYIYMHTYICIQCLMLQRTIIMAVILATKGAVMSYASR